MHGGMASTRGRLDGWRSRHVKYYCLPSSLLTTNNSNSETFHTFSLSNVNRNHSSLIKSAIVGYAAVVVVRFPLALASPYVNVVSYDILKPPGEKSNIECVPTSNPSMFVETAVNRCWFSCASMKPKIHTRTVPYPTFCFLLIVFFSCRATAVSSLGS